MNKNAQTADLRRHLEEASGQDLEQFFDQWLFQGGIPTIRARWNQSDSGIRASLQQVQETYGYELEVDVQFRFEDDSVTDVITVSFGPGGAAATMSVVPPHSGKVVEMIMDPNVRLLANFDVAEGR
jgi:aminopeptidase N